ncbi:MAG: ABC transporter ATP-binding protein [Patescibacteria group bacterium]
MNTLRIKKLHKQYGGVSAVDNLSLEISSGKITSIVGPNGSGKSTLVNLLTGFVPIDSGEVDFGHEKLLSIKAYEIKTYGLTRTFQEVRLFEQMKVLDNILVVLTGRSVWSALFERHEKFHHDKAEDALRRVGLWEKRNELAKNLSYGQRKLLEIARVIAMNAEIILFDEPFAGLFPEMLKIVVKILKEFREQGKTIILIEHNMDLIRELSDHLFVMDSGKLLTEGKPEVVLARRDVIEAYLGE